MDKLLICAVCLLEYDTNSQKPCIGTCGHSICCKCASEEICEDCPVCRRNGAFNEIVVNFGLMNLIECINKKKKEQEETRRKEMEGICCLCKKESKHLAICIDCSLDDGILFQDDSELQNNDDFRLNWNTETRSLDDCIRKAEASSFCPDCSIGAVHGGHRTGSFKTIQQTIFTKSTSGIKEEIESFLKSFDKLKEQVIHKFDEYRENVSSLIDYMCQFTIDQFTNYPMQVLEFIKKSKSLSNHLASCHQDITTSIKDFEKKLEHNLPSNDIDVKQETIYHIKNYENKLEIYSFNTISNALKMEIEISKPKGSTSIVHKNNVYIIGGYIDKNCLQTVEVYDVLEKTRKELANLNEARMDSSVYIHKSKLFVCGGKDFSTSINSVEEYDFEKNEWNVLGKLNSNYYSTPKIVYLKNSLYVIGEINGNHFIIEKYINKKYTFIEAYCCQMGRFHDFFDLLWFHDCAVFDGKIFIIVKSLLLSEARIWIYNPSTNKRIQLVRKKKVVDGKFYSVNNQLYLIESDSIEVFNLNNKEFELLYTTKK